MPTTDQISAQAKAVIARCRKLATFSEEPGRTTRTFLSPPMRDCHREIADWIRPLGAAITIDAVGNFRAFYAAANPQFPRLLIGSHLDTVPDAGAFDGVLGVVLGAALLELVRERPAFGIELVGFSEEEGVRFGIPFIGSLALVGRIDEDMLAREDKHGISVRTAIENFGLAPSKIPDASLKGDVLGYLEFHIEQGPVLEELGLPLGVVEAVVGQSRLEIKFVGRANHAGTTPMHLRRDAIAGAAEWITAVEQEAKRVPGLVATVGAIRAKPGAMNVIAGEAQLTLDVRHAADEIRTGVSKNLIRLATEIAARRELTLRHNVLSSQPSVPMNSVLIGYIEEAIRRAGCEPHRMVSGAGHDAMILAQKVPAAMIFIRTPGGISHSPEESVKIEDVEKALQTGVHLLDVLASSSPLEKPRLQRA